MCRVIVLLSMKIESGMAVVVFRLLASISGSDEFLCVPSVMSLVIPKGIAAFKSETAERNLKK